MNICSGHSKMATIYNLSFAKFQTFISTVGILLVVQLLHLQFFSSPFFVQREKC